MTDLRTLASNGRVASLELRGQVKADKYVEGELRQVAVPLLDLRAAPDGPRDRQLLLGATLRVLENLNGWSFVQAEADGYVGYVPSAALHDALPTTHFVHTFGTHVYPEPDMKTPELHALSFGARLTVSFELQKFWETPIGFIPKSHLRPLDRPLTDPATVAQMHFNVPYLWGGNSTHGIDCSGLVQAGLLACGISCPGDSDLQTAIGADVTGAPKRGDLVFWRGHVAMMIDDETLIHANAHHMAVRYEPLETARLRISAQDGGDITQIRRP